MRLAHSISAAALRVCIVLLLPFSTACEKLRPDQSTREATSVAEVARLAAEARPVTTLVLLGPGITDAALARCAYVRALEIVVLIDCDAATAAGLSEFVKVRQLSQLGINDCDQLDGAALRGLQHLPKLAELRLTRNGIDAAMLDAVAHCTTLKSVRLSGALAANADLGALGTLPGLESIDLGNLKSVPATMLADLRHALPSCIVLAPR